MIRPQKRKLAEKREKKKKKIALEDKLVQVAQQCLPHIITVSGGTIVCPQRLVIGLKKKLAKKKKEREIVLAVY